METRDLDVPPAWQAVDWAQMRGVVLVVGATDAGKTTFARYLIWQLQAAGVRVGWLDGDPGQSDLGPPATMTLAGPNAESDALRDRPKRHVFVGAVSPVGHMLRVVVGARRLVDAAGEAEADAIVYDTTGLIDPDRGGLYLKHALIDVLQPSAVIGLQRDDELERLLTPLRRRSSLRVVTIAPSDAVEARSPHVRQDYRARRFERYFADAESLTVRWPELAVVPAPQFDRNRLVALGDEAGFARALALIKEDNRDQYTLILHTPLRSLDAVETLCIGDVQLDPETFRDRRLLKP